MSPGREFPLPPRFSGPGGVFPSRPGSPRLGWAARQTRWRVGNPTTGQGHWAGVSPPAQVLLGPPRFSEHWPGVSHSRPGSPRLPGGTANPLEGGKPYNGAGALGGSFPLPPRFSEHWTGVSPPVQVLLGCRSARAYLAGSFPLPSRFSLASERRGKPVGGWETLQRGALGGSFPSRPGFPSTGREFQSSRPGSPRLQVGAAGEPVGG